MELDKQRALLIEDLKAFLSIIDSKGIGFTPPFTESDWKTMDLSDLKRLVNTARELARTPSGQSA